MKRILLLAAALTLSIPAFGTADAKGHGGDKHENQGARNARVERGFKEDRKFERRVYKSDRNFGYQRVANGRKFKYKGRAFVAVDAPAFSYPRGFAYRHWTAGAILPALFIAETLFVDYAWIGLPSPPPGYEWVRYGPDALLVNIYSGRIADVAYDVFY